METEKQKVWLRISGCDENEGTQSEISDFCTEGEFYRDGDTDCFSYNEAEESGMGDTLTTVRVENDKVTVMRLGDINSVMEFQEHKTKTDMYETPFGEITMSLYTRELEIAYADDNDMPQHIRIKYDIEVKGLLEGTNVIDITAKRQSTR